jgi:hypothetical protein
MLPNTRASLYDPLDQELMETREELRLLRGQRHKEAEMRLKEEAHFRDVLYTTIEKWKRQQLHHHIPLQLYYDAVNKASKTSMTSPTILQQQAKLCRSLHVMGIIEKQVQLNKTGSLEHAKFCQRLVAREQDTKTFTEIDLMSQLLSTHREVDRLEQQVRDLTQMRLTLADHSIIMTNHSMNSRSERSELAVSRSERSELTVDSRMSEESSSSMPVSLLDLFDESIHDDMMSRRQRVATIAC